MYDHGNKRYQRDELKPSKTATRSTAEAERRGGDRHLVTASAEVIELSSGARFTTRTTDLGPGGCFVDTLTPFPVGAQVRVTVYRGNSRFETRGTIVYSQPGLGMGVAFEKLDAGQRAALDAWFEQVTAGRHIPESRRPPAYGAKEAASDRVVLTRLVQLLITKGIISESEGSSVFYDPMI
jgi:PilZ domain